jgi:hypothetical protein
MINFWKKKPEPPKAKYTPGTMLAVRVSADSLAALKVFAQASGKTLSAYVRDILIRECPELTGCQVEVEVTPEIHVSFPDWPHLKWEWTFA